MNTLLILALTLSIAYCIKRFVHKIGIPIVTGYVLTGILLGVSMLKIFSIDTLNSLGIVNDFALGIIGFTIGAELRREVFQRLGRAILTIALFEAISAFVLVTLFIYIIDPSKIYQALILGAVASATAPAATIVEVLRPLKNPAPIASSSGPYFMNEAYEACPGRGVRFVS